MSSCSLPISVSLILVIFLYKLSNSSISTSTSFNTIAIITSTLSSAKSVLQIHSLPFTNCSYLLSLLRNLIHCHHYSRLPSLPTPPLPPGSMAKGQRGTKNAKVSRDDDGLGGQRSVGAALFPAIRISSDRHVDESVLSDGCRFPGGQLQGRFIALSRHS